MKTIQKLSLILLGLLITEISQCSSTALRKTGQNLSQAGQRYFQTYGQSQARSAALKRQQAVEQRAMHKRAAQEKETMSQAEKRAAQKQEYQNMQQAKNRQNLEQWNARRNWAEQSGTEGQIYNNFAPKQRPAKKIKQQKQSRKAQKTRSFAHQTANNGAAQEGQTNLPYNADNLDKLAVYSTLAAITVPTALTLDYKAMQAYKNTGDLRAATDAINNHIQEQWNNSDEKQLQRLKKEYKETARNKHLYTQEAKLDEAIEKQDIDAIKNILDYGFVTPDNYTKALVLQTNNPEIIQLFGERGLMSFKKDDDTYNQIVKEEKAQQSWYDWLLGKPVAIEKYNQPQDWGQHLRRYHKQLEVNAKNRENFDKELDIVDDQIENLQHEVDKERDYQSSFNDNYQLEKPFSQALKEEYPQALTDTRTEDEQAADLEQAEQDYVQSFEMNY